MATRVTDAALVSRVSRLRRSRARALLSLNLKKKRDCPQSNVFMMSIIRALWKLFREIEHFNAKNGAFR